MADSEEDVAENWEDADTEVSGCLYCTEKWSFTNINDRSSDIDVYEYTISRGVRGTVGFLIFILPRSWSVVWKRDRSS